MLLKALYDFAVAHRLPENEPFEERLVHLIIPLNDDGTLRSQHLILLTEPDRSGKQRPGQRRWMPRFAGENNGGKAYFLAGSATAVLGRKREDGSPISSNVKQGKNDTKAFLHFWQQIEEAQRATGDRRLAALLEFRRRNIPENDGRINCAGTFLQSQPDSHGKPLLLARVGESEAYPLKSATIAFSVGGNPLTLDEPQDPLRAYWTMRYSELAREVDDSGQPGPADPLRRTARLCLVTGLTGRPIARSHKPKIGGIPSLLTTGGYVVSFERASPAFSSYGCEMGENAPVSEEAAAAYALALNWLLDSEDHHLDLNPVSVCFWAKERAEAASLFKALLEQAHPEQVRDFLQTPFAGCSDTQDPRRDRFYTVALSGNAARVVVRAWLDQSLDQAVTNYRYWWEDLQIVQGDARGSDRSRATRQHTHQKSPPSPYAIPRLAGTTVSQSRKQRDKTIVGERIVALFRAALEGTPPPLSLLKPVLDEFKSALLKNDESEPRKRTYPFDPARFALIKLILVRNARTQKEPPFMATAEIAETNDAAYNLGRLLAVFERLQSAYHEYKKTGPGVVERYYGAASSAPSATFPMLSRLARHHLGKLTKGDDKERRSAASVERSIEEILSRFRADAPGAPPRFPAFLSLEEQGRFALGFYQQRSHRPRQAAPASGVGDEQEAAVAEAKNQATGQSDETENG
ncbi:MAG: type I-C CRISPR-associated protein Cas8c/Csd1 [Planctomycetota bacterium]